MESRAEGVIPGKPSAVWRTLAVVLGVALVAEVSTSAPAKEGAETTAPPLMRLLPASGVEDDRVPIPIRVDAPSVSEVLLVTIDGVPPGARLSAGTDEGGGSWTLARDQLTDLALIPPPDFNGDFALSVTLTAVVSEALPVIVTPVADPPVLEVSAAAGAEDRPVPISLTAYSEQGEAVSIAVSGVPEGARLSAGTDDGSGVWKLAAEDLTGLQLIPPANYSGVIELTALAVARDGADTAIATQPMPVVVAPVADPPVLTLIDTTGEEDTLIPLAIAATGAPNEALSISIEGLPPGAGLTAGEAREDGWVMVPGDLTDLQLVPPRDFNGPLGLRVVARSAHGADVAQAGAFLMVLVTPVADAPQLDVAPAAGTADEPIALDITVRAGGPTEMVALLVGGMPEGASLSAGVNNRDGTWSVPRGAVDDLFFLTAPGQVGPVVLDVAALATEPVGQDMALVTAALRIDVRGRDDEAAVDVVAPDRLQQTEIVGPTGGRVVPRPDPIRRLVAQGLRSRHAGDVLAIREMLSSLAQVDAVAATALGETYDPGRLGNSPLGADLADPDRAVAWYRTAIALGSEQARCYLDRLVEAAVARRCKPAERADLVN